MAKRHQLDPHNWESVFGRLEELVLAGSGEDAFSEVFKLLIAQLATESTSEGALLGQEPASTRLNVQRSLNRAEKLWPTILAGDDEVRLRPEQLHECVAVLDEVSIADSSLEVMDGVFEFLMTHSHKGAKGQYFTPRHVIEAVVRIVDPRPGEQVLDPACGSSGFLLHSIAHAQAVLPDATPSVWGFDVDAKAIQVSKAMMLIAGGRADAIVRLNSLVTPAAGESLFSLGSPEHSLTIEDVVRTSGRSFDGFDAIITNPPFAGEIREPTLVAAYELADPNRRNERDVLFVERCVRLLRPGGRLAIVLPTGRAGSKSSARMREWLVRHLQVVGVLSLGRPTFQPHTSQKAEVIFGVKRAKPITLRSATAEPVLFMASEKPGKDSKGKVIERASPMGSSLWDRADHDYEDAVELFDRHVTNHQIAWSRHS